MPQPPRMRIAHLITAFRFFTVIAAAVSAMLFVEYAGATQGTFCGFDGGCAAVRASVLSQRISQFGIDVPQIGVFAFVGLLTASLFATSRLHHKALAALSVAGALLGLGFIFAQLFVIEAVCPFCMVVDLSSLGAAATAVAIARKVPAANEPTSTRSMIAWALAAVCASSLPFIWREFPERPPAPEAIAALAKPGKLTLVMFTDFECPFCRRMHLSLEGIKAQRKDAVAAVRVMAPLDLHKGALPAAKAYVCTPEASREAMATALYSVEPELLEPQAILDLAGKQGIDKDAFAKCVNDPATADKVAAEKAMFKSVGGRGLPLVFVGGTAVLGFAEDELQIAIERGIDGGLELPPWAMYMAFLTVLFAAIYLTWNEELRAAAPAADPPDVGD